MFSRNGLIQRAKTSIPSRYCIDAITTVELVNLADGFSCYTTSEWEARFIYKEIFEDGCYDTELSKDPFIIDVGANIGLFSLYMKQKHPSSKIIAFEPVPQIFELLSRNLTLHNITGVETHLYRLRIKQSTEKITYFPNTPGNSTLHPEDKKVLRDSAAQMYGQEFVDQRAAGMTEVDVKIQRLSHFRNDYAHIPSTDLLKIGVEGAELDVLRGLDDVHWDKVRHIILETCVTSGVRPEIEELLRLKGYTVTSETAPWAPDVFYMISAHRAET